MSAASMAVVPAIATFAVTPLCPDTVISIPARAFAPYQ